MVVHCKRLMLGRCYDHMTPVQYDGKINAITYHVIDQCSNDAERRATPATATSSTTYAV
jgi:hypothetical protein